MKGSNSTTMRVYPEDEQYLREIARIRRDLKKDKKEASPARVLKAYINATKQDPKLRKLLTEATFR